MNNLVKEFGLNEEQIRAFTIIARHVRHEKSLSQLCMYLGGMAGTGKSQVIKCVIRLFELIREREKLIILGPTGASAALIGGSTFHSFLGLRSRSSEERSASTDNLPKFELLEKLRKIRYIILNEVSMLSCQDMYRISSSLSNATNDVTKSFGGLNVIFADDFAQLESIMTSSLFDPRYGTRYTEGMFNRQQECTISKAI